MLRRWTAAFFLIYQLPAGTKYRVSFDYKADKNADYSTEVHTEPGSYIWWVGVGNGSFTTDWQTYEAKGTISVLNERFGDTTVGDKIWQTVDVTNGTYDIELYATSHNAWWGQWISPVRQRHLR